MNIANNWKDYEILDAGNGEKLERWGNVILRRPDPTAIWPHTKNENLWKKNDGHYHRSNKGGGSWTFSKKLPECWTVEYKDLRFKVSPTGFKHTGLFPEQAVNWDWMSEAIKNDPREIKVLNLFAYTGGATMACSAAGAKEVVHVDASKGMVAWAKENIASSGLSESPVRFIIDDVTKFVQREIRRGNKYDAIIMDPPSYGRGPTGEVWNIEKDLYPLIETDESIKLEDYLENIIALGEYDGKLYESLSGGEKQKIDIIVQFAIRDMLSQFSSFSSNILSPP